MSTQTLRHYSGAKIVAFRFYLHQNIRQAAIIGWLAAFSAASSLIGFIAAYPDEASRQGFVTSFTSNSGLKLLLGTPHDIATVGGFVAWRTLGILVLIGSVWALMLSTRVFRGEEQAGRTELLVAGQTSLRRQTAQLVGVMLAVSTVVLSLVFLATYAASLYKHIGLSISSIAFFALSLTLSITLFTSVGALSGQLFATRAQALRIGGLVYGLAFLFRGLGSSVSDVHVLKDMSPIGWIESLQPFTGSYWQWLVPIFTFIGVCYVLAIWLAGKRDLGMSVFADNDSAPPHFRFLSSPLGLWIRLSRPSILGWALGIFAISYIFGTVAKSAGDAFSSSVAAQNIVNKLAQSTDSPGIKLFYGMVFLIVMLLILVMVAGMVSAIREEESEGYTDNLLVRSVARLTVISNKLLIILSAIISVSVLSILGGWLGGVSQHANVTLHALLPAIANSIAAGLLLVGIGVFAYGFKPRLTSVVVYSVLGWAFLIEMIGAILNLNHWILDTSILHHLPLVPAVAINWQIIVMYCVIGVLLTVLGILRFTKRDIEAN